MPVAGFWWSGSSRSTCSRPGDPSPLPYLPLANPLDLTLALALCGAAAWAMRLGTLPERALYRWIGAGVFVALNGVVLRTAHQWGDVPWRLSSLLASKPLQAALTLTWTLTALAAMVVATRRHLRMLWMLGAALLAAVVAKLFLRRSRRAVGIAARRRFPGRRRAAAHHRIRVAVAASGSGER